MPFYRFIKGNFVIVSYEPDGDSVRFIADNAQLFQGLKRSHRIQISKKDGSVQLRFEGVDSTELHYGNAAQPLGAEARDQLLNWMGFSEIQFDKKRVTMVTSAHPGAISGGILTKGVDPHGRPIVYALLGANVVREKDGATVNADAALLSKTMNQRLLETGMAYPLFYSSMPQDDQQQFRKAAAQARKKQLGVWKIDTTREFVLIDQVSIGPDGECIFPKIFRRCTDFLKAVTKGFSGDLVNWLISTHGDPKGTEDDQVITHATSSNPVEVRLSSVVQQRNNRVVFQPDLLDIVFIEK